MFEQLFSYGSLREPEIQKRIIDRLVKGIPDTLKGYKKSTIELYNRTYPIISQDPKTDIEGQILLVTLEELIKIDDYETDVYKRIKVVLKSGKKAWVYIKPEA